MPLQDWNLGATWQNAYRLKKASNPNEWAAGYERDCSMYPAAAFAAGQIVNALNIQPSDTVLILGCGFGWIANNIALITGCTLAAVDTSTWIQTRKAQDADIEILNADVSAGNGRAAVKQALGITGNNKATYALTEEVITCLTDQEAQQLSNWLHDLATNVVHWTTLRDDRKLARGNQEATGYNWKLISEWQALLPSDSFIVSGTSVLVS